MPHQTALTHTQKKKKNNIEEGACGNTGNVVIDTLYFFLRSQENKEK